MQITRGKIAKPLKTVIYGPEGIGKTTFATHFPDPLYCDTEGGSHNIDVARTPVPTSWQMLLDMVREIIADPTLCRTFVLDTADWAERLCVKHVCDKYNQSGVETFGYGKGYVYVYEEFGRLLDLLSTLIERGVHVVVTAHAQLRKFEQPDEMGSYDRYELKLSKKTGAQVSDMLKEWADLLLFANYKTLVVNVDGQGAAKGKNKAQGGQRVMYATHTPSWDAKNRHGLPDEMPFDFKPIAHLFAASAAYTPPTQKPAPSTPAPPPPAPVATKAEDPAAPPMDGQTLEGDAALEAITEASKASDSIPKALQDLMKRDQVTDKEIMFAVASKGYYTGDTPITNYVPDFINGVLIAAWPQVHAMVKANREKTPF
ncbi:MAG: ATP-binding protein [Candidatus Limiplasma sp.]|nr:ATP-binding protein [Candidatus Limiplasma sp.]MEA5144523.1 ATP-binding protein [Candidatus Limiplasma sp.]